MSDADWIAAHAAFHLEVKALLGELDGTRGAVVAMLTGFTREELDDLGGVPECP